MDPPRGQPSGQFDSRWRRRFGLHDELVGGQNPLRTLSGGLGIHVLPEGIPDIDHSSPIGQGEAANTIGKGAIPLLLKHCIEFDEKF